ncbi:MAG: Na+/H+ antiporter [Gluconacetobacter diazotrophicus]|nr:Na+/H+ antiporter [Gluconacetobacter diazotrophicus]
MHAATATLLLLFITALSAPLGRVIRIPLALLQIILGVLASLLGAHLGIRVGFDPDVFMLLFVPPLLFSDAFRTPLRELRQLSWPILTLAVGLVLFTTLGCGKFIDWLIPPIPLAAAFALAAVLSPTDAVAVGSMLEGRNVPPRFLHVLSGEALLNDASGLVCFKFAAAAAMTGAFSITSAGIGFLVIAAGGLLVGALLAIGLAVVQQFLLRRHFDHAITYLTLTALLPFAAYLLAEHLGTSGILAAVSAGLVLRRGRTWTLVASETRLVVHAVWEVITFLFNGMIFLLLGMQLPEIIRDGVAIALQDRVSPWAPLWAIVLITAVLLALRLVWIVGLLTLRRVTHWRSWKDEPHARPRVVAALAVAGARGAITLAAVSSLAPEFPQRGLLLVLAAGVIICSLLVAAVALPLLLAGFQPDPEAAGEMDRTRLALSRLAIGFFERAGTEAAEGEPGGERAEVVARLLAESTARARRLSVHVAHAGDDETESRAEQVLLIRRERQEVALRLRLLREQRAALEAMCRDDEINDETEQLIMREMDLREETLLSRAALLPHEADLYGEAAAPAAVAP